MAKFNEQTIEVCFPGSSTLEFQTIQSVPVYEPARVGWMDLYYNTNQLTVVDEWGDAVRLNVDTGRVEAWSARPILAQIATMKPNGSYFEFRTDGSIAAHCENLAPYYWGPITREATLDVIGISMVPCSMLKGDFVTGWTKAAYIEKLRTFHATLLRDHEIQEDYEERLEAWYARNWLYDEAEAYDRWLDGRYEQDDEDPAWLHRD